MMLDTLTKERFGRRTFESFEAETPDVLDRAEDLRRELRRVAYDGPNICALLGIASLLALDPDHFHHLDRSVLPDTPLADLIRLLLLDIPRSRSAIERALSPGAVDFLVELGVIVPEADLWRASIHLFCAGDLLLATDTGRYSPLWPEGEDLTDRVMYIGYDSVGLTCVTPRTPSRRTLDLCSGSGIQAIAAARHSEEVIGVDLNPRAVRFARFNAALNGARNARFIQGDLFEPVRESSFDLILANPPFVPQPEGLPRLLYRDGGPTGEDVLMRILREGPLHLSERGSLAISTDLINLSGLEARIREWRDPASPPVDVLVLVERALPFAAYAAGHAVHLSTARERRVHIRALLDHFRSAGISELHGGYIVLRRLPASAKGSHQIIDTAEAVTRPVSSHVEAYFRHIDAIRSGAIQRARVGLAERLRFRVESWTEGGEERSRFEIVSPDDDFFPPLEINEGIYELLHYIQKGRPRWTEIANDNTLPLLSDLLGRGVLQLFEISE